MGVVTLRNVVSVWGASGVLLLLSGGVWGQSTVESRVQQLEDTVRLLNERVALLESQMSGPTPSAGVAPERASWRKLRRGMSEAEVEELLGSPVRVEARYARTVWYYGDMPWSGEASFDAESRKLEMWKEPSSRP